MSLNIRCVWERGGDSPRKSTQPGNYHTTPMREIEHDTIYPSITAGLQWHGIQNRDTPSSGPWPNGREDLDFGKNGKVLGKAKPPNHLIWLNLKTVKHALEPDGNEIEKVDNLAIYINLEVQSDDVQELLESYRQEQTITELIEMHE
ncbi:hypothetical protein TNCV_4599691 [Trichonephila clavipes]|nr:hypothetical protein TNCV_4599691 [Trichonephila clavipes]